VTGRPLTGALRALQSDARGPDVTNATALKSTLAVTGSSTLAGTLGVTEDDTLTGRSPGSSEATLESLDVTSATALKAPSRSQAMTLAVCSG
jgi:hypothetical protein